MKKTLTILALSALLFTSCKKEETTDSAPPEETVADGTAVTADSLTATAETAVAAPQAPTANGVPAGSVMTTQPQTTTTTSSVQYNPKAKGMNPAHGQPGHRCDIEVGMPLNSPPGKKAANIIQPTITKASSVTPAMINQANAPTTTDAIKPATDAAPVVTAPGMNPPHGQEGHVCGVGVGEPLPKK